VPHTLACDRLGGPLTLASESPLRRALYRALHDPLTGLANRGLLMDRLTQSLARAGRRPGSVAVLFLDLDRFKVVNDTMGHAAGDRLLVQVGQVLRRQCRALDVVGRLGGDEFLVILPMTKPAEARVFVARVQASLREIEKTNPEFGTCTLSMGIAESPQHGTTVSSVLAAADNALYRAKRGGRNTVEVAEA